MGSGDLPAFKAFWVSRLSMPRHANTCKLNMMGEHRYATICLVTPGIAKRSYTRSDTRNQPLIGRAQKLALRANQNRRSSYGDTRQKRVADARNDDAEKKQLESGLLVANEGNNLLRFGTTVT